MKIFEMKPVLVKNSNLMTELKSSLYIEYNKERIGVHVSDLLYCPRQSVFRKLKPQAVTDKELNFFTSGQSIHTAIQTLAKYYPKYEIEKEIVYTPFPELKILAHIDLYDSEKNIPIEAKSARKARLGIYDKKTKTYSEEQPKSFNVTQLKIYMSLTDSNVGYLMYQLLMNFEDYPFEIFEVTMTEEDRKSMLKWLTREAVSFVNGLNRQDPSIVRHIAGDSELGWKCDSCPFLNECLEMRNAEYIAKKYT